MPIVGEAIEIFEPFDTTTGQYTPANINAAIAVSTGDFAFAWTPVADADGYIVLLLDLAQVSTFESSDLTTHSWQWTMQPAATVHLSNEASSLLFQVFAYRGSDIVRQSEVWVVEPARP